MYIVQFYFKEIFVFTPFFILNELVWMGLTILILTLLFLYVIYRYHSHLKFAKFIIHNAHNGVVITDKHNHIVFVNEAMEKMTGYTFEELKAKNPSTLKSGQHNKEFYQNLWESLLETGQWAGEIWDAKKDGSIYPKHVRIYALKNRFRKGIHHFLAIHEDLTFQKQTEANLSYMRNHVFSTNLPNQYTFLKAMNQNILRNLPFTVIYIKVTNYHYLVMNFSKEVYDQKVVHFAKQIQDRWSSMDLLGAQTNDDSFLLLISFIEKDKVIEIMEEMIHLSNANCPDEGRFFHFELKFGTSEYPKDGKDAQNLMINANLAFDWIEDDITRKYAFYRTSYTKNVNQEAMIKEQLSRAIKNGEFVLYYQPKVDARTNTLIGAEALIRWNSSTMGIVSPSKFIPVAEKFGYMDEIGEFVIREVLRNICEFNQNGLNHIKYSFNVTASQLNQQTLLRALRTGIKENQVNPKQLEVEITESVLIKDIQEKIRYLASIRELGITIAIDDFGTGYSSLGYLKEMPLDTLKIDRTFIKDIPNPDHGEVAESIIAMAKLFHLEIVAEGAETKAQVDFLL